MIAKQLESGNGNNSKVISNQFLELSSDILSSPEDTASSAPSTSSAPSPSDFDPDFKTTSRKKPRVDILSDDLLTWLDRNGMSL